MRTPDLLRFSSLTLISQRFRGIMIIVAMSLGVAAVLVLTALGEGARGYVIGEFSSIGKNVLELLPGRKETTDGSMPPMMGTAARDITLEEAAQLPKRISGLKEVSPVVIGSSHISFQDREREVMTFGTTTLFTRINSLVIGQGSNFTDADFRRDNSEVIIGYTVKKSLFDSQPAIGQFIRIDDSRFRVIGILAEGSEGRMGVNFDEAVIIPVAAAQRLFNVEGVFRLLMFVRDGYSIEQVIKRIEETMTDFHQGELDVTIISPDAMRSTFDSILKVMTLVVGAIGSISLLVAGVLIMNVMLISVSQRTREIGLLKAIGASSNDVLRLFLTEAMLMTGLGSVAGIILGVIVVFIGCQIFPDVPFRTPLWAFVSAVVMALFTGLAFSWLPARRASQLQPVQAMQKP